MEIFFVGIIAVVFGLMLLAKAQYKSATATSEVLGIILAAAGLIMIVSSLGALKNIL